MMDRVRILTLFLAVPALVCTGCSHGNIMETNHILDKKAIRLLQDTTEAIDYDFGYDSVNDLFYVYLSRADKSNLAKLGELEKRSKQLAEQRELAKVLNAANPADLQNFYYGVVRINMTVSHKADYFKKRKIWPNYTYFKNYLLPPAVKFREAVKKAMIAKDASFLEFDKAAEVKAANWVRWYYRYQEEAVDTFP